MIADMAIELQGTGVHAINFHPGPVETEAAQLLSSDVTIYRFQVKQQIVSGQASFYRKRIDLLCWPLPG